MKLLIIDDDPRVRESMQAALAAEGHDVRGAANAAAALEAVEDDRMDAAFLDLELNGDSSLELLPQLLALAPELDVIALAADPSIDQAVEAVKLGAVEFLTKPVGADQLRQLIKHFQHTRRLADRVQSLQDRLTSEIPEVDLTTEEPTLATVYEQALKAADSAATLLLLGESGTGKSVLARAIHQRSPYSEKEFVTVSCPSLSRELLESELFGHVKGSFTGALKDTWGKVAQADGGTLFLDEIGELSPEIQPKLLRLLQDQEYERLGEHKVRKANVRVIAATNRDLAAAVKDGRFRMDLFYRLNVIALELPPLRQRQRDLPRLAGQYLRFFNRQCGTSKKGFSEAARQALASSPWKGNLRELRNAVERAVVLSDGEWIEPRDLPAAVTAAAAREEGAQPVLGGNVTLQDLEREHIRRVINRSRTLEAAAGILGINPATLYRKRKRLFRSTE
jgi:two-component system, NtrC family, response regulator AlgB